MNMDCSSKAAFRSEFFRKLLHLPALLFLLIGYYSPKISIGVLISLICFYLLEYKLRSHSQIKTPYLSNLILRFSRSSEFDYGPLFLALSLVLLQLFFPFISAVCGVLMIVIADSFAACFGVLLGRRKIFYSSHKSYMGSFAFFSSAFLSLFFLIGLYPALFLALLGCFLESLPLKQLDNLIVPLGVSLAHYLFFYQV